MRRFTVMDEKLRNLDLFGYRDFTLATAQMGTEAESLGLYLNDVKLVRPYFVVERKDGKSAYFIDTAQVSRQKEILLEKIGSDAGFVDTLIDTSAQYYDELEPVLNDGQPLSRAEFARLVEPFTRAWSWMAGWWWATEAMEEKGRHPDLVEKIMVFRRKTEKIIPQIDHLTRVTAETLYPEVSEYADVLTIEEISSGEIPPESSLEERLRHYFLMNNEVFVGEEIGKALHDMHIVLSVPRTADFKVVNDTFAGQTAYKGRYTGRVSIVFTREGANNFREGDVLVASSTTPDFIHAIKKAGAMVADEGGIISHAAITSRELKVPCIIGTRIATQILKNGDMVEVDADNGIVRVLT